jgi:hypothetical protein
MAEAGGKWAFVEPCGCVYGFRYDMDEVITTPMQAWAVFYEGQPKLRAHDEAAGYFCRPWDKGDRLNWGDCPHVAVAESVDAGPVLF